MMAWLEVSFELGRWIVSSFSSLLFSSLWISRWGVRHTVVRRKGDALDEFRVGIVDVDVAEVFEAMEHGASHGCVCVC